MAAIFPPSFPLTPFRSAYLWMFAVNDLPLRTGNNPGLRTGNDRGNDVSGVGRVRGGEEKPPLAARSPIFIKNRKSRDFDVFMLTGSACTFVEG